MLIHTVLFWLKPEPDRAAFMAALDVLTGMDEVREGYAGVPAATGSRSVVDDSYDAGLTLIFDDLFAHDAYQTAPAHAEFVAANEDKWTRILVYDQQVD